MFDKKSRSMVANQSSNLNKTTALVCVCVLFDPVVFLLSCRRLIGHWSFLFKPTIGFRNIHIDV